MNLRLRDYWPLNRGRAATVVVWRLARLGRAAAGLTALFNDLADRKVNLISLREAVAPTIR